MSYDMQTITLLACTALLAFGLALLGARLRLWGAPQGQDLFDKLLGLGAEQRLMALTIIGLAAGLVSCIFLAMQLFRPGIEAGTAALIGTVIGTILAATLTQPWGYWFGSSKGSTDKSALLAGAADKAAS